MWHLGSKQSGGPSWCVAFHRYERNRPRPVLLSCRCSAVMPVRTPGSEIKGNRRNRHENRNKSLRNPRLVYRPRVRLICRTFHASTGNYLFVQFGGDIQRQHRRRKRFMAGSQVATGTNSAGYILNSVQIEMTAASGAPNGFTLMICTNSDPFGTGLGGNIGSLSGSGRTHRGLMVLIRFRPQKRHSKGW